MHKRNDQFFNKVNDQIRHSVVMVVQDGKNLGTFSANEAKKIAKDAKIDAANFAIFINGYVLHYKRVS